MQFICNFVPLYTALKIIHLTVHICFVFGMFVCVYVALMACSFLRLCQSSGEILTSDSNLAKIHITA